MRKLFSPLLVLFCSVALAADPTPDRIKSDIEQAEKTNAVILKMMIRQGKGQLLTAVAGHIIGNGKVSELELAKLALKMGGVQNAIDALTKLLD